MQPEAASRQPAQATGAALTRIRTDAQLKEYLLATYGVVLPDTQVCPDHTTPFRAFADAYFARAPISVWLGSRGLAGKSFTLALLGLVEATTLGADVTVLGGSGEQSTRVLSYMGKFWGAPHAPSDLLASDPAKRETRLVTGNTIQALTASQRSVRGPHPSRLRCVAGDTLVNLDFGRTEIRNIEPGMQVKVIHDLQPFISVATVSRVWCTGKRKTLRMWFDNGACIDMTPDHKLRVYVDCGDDLYRHEWKQADQFKVGDVVQGIILSGYVGAVYITSIEPGPEVDVWDMTVPGSHSFLAYNINVHNCDEVDEMDIDILDAALGQPMAARGVPQQTVLSSTHQYPDGTFTDVLKRAKEKGWKVNSWCWRETSEPHGWLAQSEIEIKRSLVPDVVWRAEYDLQEPTPEDRAIMTASVEAMFKNGLGVFEGAAGEYIEIEPPQPGGVYATGGDWARKKDWTITLTLRVDCNPMRLVAFERNGRLPWPLMIARFDYQVNRYGSDAAHDGTGLGDVVDGYISVPAEAVLMVGRNRSDMLSNCISAVERDEIQSPDISFLHGELKYATADDVYGTGHLPDSLSALALAYYCGTNRGASVAVYTPDGYQNALPQTPPTLNVIDAPQISGYTDNDGEGDDIESRPQQMQPTKQMAELAYVGNDPQMIYIGTRPVNLSAGWSQWLEKQQAEATMKAYPGQFAILGFEQGI